jgi:hypothetical protein
MNQQLLLYPMVTLILFTGGVGLALLTARYRAVSKDALNPAYFKYNRGGKPPEYLLKITQHFDNLLETPPLFYLSILIIFVLQKADSWYLALAWLYVVSRLAHAWVHMGNNRIVHRKNTFILSYLLLFGIWIRLLIQLLAA